MTPPGPWWGEAAGLLVFFVVPCGLAAWVLVRVQDSRRSRTAAEAARRDRLRSYACPVRCSDPTCPYRVAAGLREAS